MNVTTQDQVDPGGGPPPDGLIATAQQVFLVLRVSHINRLVGRHDPKPGWARPFNPRSDAFDLRLRYRAVDMAIAASGVHADCQHLGTVVHGFKVRAECASVPCVRSEESRSQLEKRNVVVARYHQCGRRTEARRELLRSAKLAARGALRYVARKDHQVGRLGLCETG